MAVVEEILRSEADGSISFGNHKLAKKAKVEDYEHAGDLLKVKTYNEMTKLEKNGMFLYESVPGTSVLEFKEADNSVEFIVEGDEDSQITVGLNRRIKSFKRIYRLLEHLDHRDTAYILHRLIVHLFRSVLVFPHIGHGFLAGHQHLYHKPRNQQKNGQAA